MVKKHFSEAFYAFDDPLEAAVFSMLVEMMKNRARKSALATTATQSKALIDHQSHSPPPTPRPYPLSLQQCDYKLL